MLRGHEGGEVVRALEPEPTNQIKWDEREEDTRMSQGKQAKMEKTGSLWE